MKKLINSLVIVLLCMGTLLSCEKDVVVEGITASKEVRIAVVLPEKDREPIWNNALEWAAENIRKANIGVKVVYEWVDEPTVDLTEVGLALSEREDIQSVIGCNVSANTQKLAFALARKKENIKPLFTFSTSQELPRIFGHRGFLWGLCETDISQSEIMLSCISNENPGLKKVALLAADDIYGQTFVDWFAFQAVELNLEPVCIETYKQAGELEACLERILDSGADAIVCAPLTADDVVPVQSYIDNFMYNSEDGRGITLMFTDKAYNKSILGGEYPMDYISGLAPASHPNSGFGVSYDALFDRVPYAGEAEVYDAVLITTLASIWAEQHNEKDLNKAIAALLNGKAVSQGGWTAGMMANYYHAIMAGETPAISGATGTLDFNSEYYTTIRSTSYARWITYKGKMIIIDYYSRNSDGHSSSPIAAWEWKKQHMQNMDGNGNVIDYPELKDNYAVLVAASEGWQNYRHQADVLGMYHYLKGMGYDDDHIILIMADDIAHNERNPLKGVIRRELDGENLYEDVQIDYPLGDLTLDDLKQILTGEPSEAYPVTLGSSANDNVLFFWSGHGTQQGWKWKETENLNADFARPMFSAMKFRKMFAIIETCYSGGVAQDCTDIPGLLMMTAANPYETSKADAFDNELQVYLSNTFTSSILSQLESHPQTVIRDLYLHAFDKTNGSHVMVYNSDYYGNLYLNDMGEYYPKFVDKGL
ncbi:MAG: ABC transporter substrate-binding protein [Oscillospiraceae bacterium]|nr:ABC transporter substrate-binding protein [Oscillospiraceae bacterium]